MRTTGITALSLILSTLLASAFGPAARAELRGACCGSQPAADRGRPGEYFFNLGENEFKRGHYETALQRFRQSAHWGYKTAHYNVGLMYFKGVGVAVDKPTGMAWLALAAERDDAPFIAAREWAYAQMSTAEFERANEIWRELRDDFGDPNALARANQRWRWTVIETTGSHLGGFAGSTVVASTEGGEIDLSREIQTRRQQKTPYPNLVYPHIDVGDLIPIEPAGKASGAPSAAPASEIPDQG